MRRWRVLSIMAANLGISWGALAAAGQDPRQQTKLLEEAQRIVNATDADPRDARIAKLVLRVA